MSDIDWAARLFPRAIPHGVRQRVRDIQILQLVIVEWAARATRQFSRAVRVRVRDVFRDT